MIHDVLVERRQRQRPAMPTGPAPRRDGHPAVLSLLVLTLACCAGAHLARS